jgi:hypothetical protein
LSVASTPSASEGAPGATRTLDGAHFLVLRKYLNNYGKIFPGQKLIVSAPYLVHYEYDAFALLTKGKVTRQMEGGAAESKAARQRATVPPGRSSGP